MRVILKTLNEKEVPIDGVLKPLVIESYRNKEFNGKVYSRRLRISPYTAHLIDEKLGTFVRQNGYRTRFVILDLEDIEKACEILQIEYKPINTYFDIDLKMCSFNNSVYEKL